jgi:hypothetical protein
MPDLMIRMVQPIGSVMQAGPSNRANGVGAAVQLLPRMLGGLNNLALETRIEREISGMQGEILKAMPARGGVLLCVGLQEWKNEDFNGMRAQSFLSLGIAATGVTPEVALWQAQSQPSMVAGVPDGWRRVNRYIWVTRGRD